MGVIKEVLVMRGMDGFSYFAVKMYSKYLVFHFTAGPVIDGDAGMAFSGVSSASLGLE